MQQFSCEALKLNGLCLITPFFMEDERGYFLKSYEKDIFQKFGLRTDLYEDFESFSKKGVVRGMHFQSSNPQSKLVRVLSGEIFDVAVDLRNDSDTFGKWQGVYLNDKSKQALYVPEGFAHGFLVISEFALVSYKCCGKFLKEFDTGIVWDDIEIGIDWPLHLVDKVVVSERDRMLQKFNQINNL